MTCMVVAEPNIFSWSGPMLISSSRCVPFHSYQWRLLFLLNPIPHSILASALTVIDGVLIFMIFPLPHPTGSSLDLHLYWIFHEIQLKYHTGSFAG
jgi:hypothetical protein